MRRPDHHVGGGLFEAETDGEEGGGDQVGPEDLDWGERENAGPVPVLEGKPDEQEDDLGDVGN